MPRTYLPQRPFVIAALVMLTLCLTLAVTHKAAATDAPLSEIYFYNHPAVGDLGAYNTTLYKPYSEWELDSAGYDCRSYTNVPAGGGTAGSVIRTLDDDAVFHINSHAGPGRMAVVDNSNQITRLSAKKVNSDNTVYSLEWNFGSTTTKLKQMRLAYYAGCHTYGTDATYGSLNSYTITLGVDSCVTHRQNYWSTEGGCYFSYYFLKYLDDNQTVSTALVNAKTKALAVYPNDHCVESVDYYVSGWGSIKIEPASYGS